MLSWIFLTYFFSMRDLDARFVAMIRWMKMKMKMILLIVKMRMKMEKQNMKHEMENKLE